MTTSMSKGIFNLMLKRIFIQAPNTMGQVASDIILDMSIELFVKKSR